MSNAIPESIPLPEDRLPAGTSSEAVALLAVKAFDSGPPALQETEPNLASTMSMPVSGERIRTPDGNAQKSFTLSVEWSALRRAYLASRELKRADRTTLRLCPSCITIIRRADGLSSEVDVPVDQKTASFEGDPIELRIMGGLFRDLLCHPHFSSAASDRITFGCKEIPDLLSAEAEMPCVGTLSIRTPLFAIEWPADFSLAANTWPNAPQPEAFKPDVVGASLTVIVGFAEPGHGTRYNNVGLINGEALAESRRTGRARLVSTSEAPFDLVVNGRFLSPLVEFLRYLDKAASQTWAGLADRYFLDERSRLAVRLDTAAPSIKLPPQVGEKAVRIKTADFVSCTTRILTQVARGEEPVRVHVTGSPHSLVQLSVRVPGGEAAISCPAEWTGDGSDQPEPAGHKMWLANTDLAHACAFSSAEWITLILRLNCVELVQDDKGLHARTVLPLKKPASTC